MGWWLVVEYEAVDITPLDQGVGTMHKAGNPFDAEVVYIEAEPGDPEEQAIKQRIGEQHFTPTFFAATPLLDLTPRRVDVKTEISLSE